MVKTPPCSDKLQMQKGIWNDDGDRERNATYVPKQDGTGNWTTFSKRSGSGQKRSGKNSREKWNNGNSKCDPKHKSFTTQEEELVIQLHSAIGSRWPIIAQQLPGRTDNDVKTLWNSKLRKKLSAMGIDPVTHKPFSQILADYGNIGAFPKARTRFSSLSKDIKNSIVFKSSNSELISQNPNNNNNNNNINPHENFSHYFHDHLFSPSSSNISDIPHYNNNNNNNPLDLYSQLQSVNFVTKKPDNNNNNLNLAQQQLFVNNECATSSSVNQEFSWSDFFLEDAQLENEGNILVAHECGGGGEKLESEEDQVKERYIINEDNNNEINALVDNNNNNTFEALSSSSNSASSFVEAMIESQDEMFSQLPCFYEEQFY